MKETENNTLRQGELEGLSKAELIELVRLYSKLFFANRASRLV